MSKYKVSVLTAGKTIEIRESELKSPGPSQVLLKVEACAICTLEQRVYSGSMKNYPFAGGHEAAGRVVEAGKNVTALKKGDLAAVRLLTNCGECYYCRTGRENQCEVSFKTQIHDGIPGPGGLAEYMLVDSRTVFKVRDDLDPRYAALAEPLACCIHSIENGKISLGDDVVIIGAGLMGAFHTRLAKLKGARVTVCEIDPARLEKAGHMGADILIDSGKTDPLKAVSEITDGRGADVVFCTAAVPALADLAIRMTGKVGRTVMYSSFHPKDPISLDINAVHYSEISITGSVNPGIRDFYTAARLLSLGLADPGELISASFPFGKIGDAFERAIMPGAYRVIVDFREYA
ncbi:MAG: alcohol dehydrogenase catalytic domain-containing protein [Treponema sp.]|nr:alcohol dehydrogenase catalytic domain-containing protein [Treponema sp.]